VIKIGTRRFRERLRWKSGIAATRQGGGALKGCCTSEGVNPIMRELEI
jgi:hypothetical protein